MTDFEIVQRPVQFFPAVHTEGWGRMAVEGLRGYGARITADTRCEKCGHLFKEGDELRADLRENWDEAPVWHKHCYPDTPK